MIFTQGVQIFSPLYHGVRFPGCLAAFAWLARGGGWDWGCGHLLVHVAALADLADENDSSLESPLSPALW